MSFSFHCRTPLVLLFFFLSFIPVWGSDSFDEIYAKINANIENEAYEANFRLIETLESSEDFQKLDCSSKGKIYHKIGVTHYLAYQEMDAIAYYEKALKLWDNCPQILKEEKANTIYNLGICHQYLGNIEKAKTNLDYALTIFENEPDYPPYDLGLKYHGVGLFYESIDDLFRAQLYFSNAASLFEKENTVAEQFEALNSSITLQMNFKDYERASGYVSKAMGLAKTHSDEIPLRDLSAVYLNASTIAYEQKEYDNAHGLAQKALSAMDTLNSPEYHAIGLEVMAFVNMEQKKFDKAEDLMKRILSIRNQFHGKGSGINSIALTYENYAELYLRKGDLEKANEWLSKAFEIVVPEAELDKQSVPLIGHGNTLDDNILIRLMELKTKIFEARYKSTGKVNWLQYSLDVQHRIDSVIKRRLLSFQFEQSKLDFFDIRFKHYDKALKDALRLYKLTDDAYYKEQAYQFSAKTKALILQQELNRINVLRATASNKTLETEKELREQMNKKQTLLLEASDTDKDSLQQAFLKAQNALDVFLINIEKTEPEYYRERYEFLKIPSIKSIQDKLPKDLAVVEFFEAKDMIYAFWISSNQFLSISVPIDERLGRSISLFSEMCRNPLEAISQSDSHYLFEKLLEQGLLQMNGIGRLCIIPDGVLHSVSFEALHNGRDYLIEDYAISYVYAMALIGREKNETNKGTENYVGFATTYSDGLNEHLQSQRRFFGEEGLTQLTLAKKEVEQASKIFGGKMFLDDGATLSNFYEHADDARIVHLSLHGLVDTDDPIRSCIIFDDSTDNFLLSPPDLYKNRLKADLVLLSACHSANGKIYNGEGVQGMSKAFLLAGSQNVLSSLWNASESSSMDITQTFLEHVEQDVPFDVALQKAKLKYLAKAPPSQQHPYYWANFILLGKVEPRLSSSFSLVLFILAGILVVGILIYFFRRNKGV